MQKIVIIDYGMGNLLSVKRACEYIGYDVLITDDPKQLKKASRVILPGVGAFPRAIARLQAKGFVEEICSYILVDKKPFLGICLGMQLMMAGSEEYGFHAGLGLIPGIVKAIDSRVLQQDYKLPYIGWSTLILKESQGGPLLRSLQKTSQFYFVHSYMAVPLQQENLYAETIYGDVHVPAVIGCENAYGCQFHPEKSGKMGLVFLKNFLCN